MKSKLIDLAALFLKLGLTAFGGPAAHIAMMQEEVVKKRQWLSKTEFLDLVSAANLIPGPNSTELAIHIGYRQAGFAGLVVSGLSFILPAVLIVTSIAAVYLRFDQLPQVTSLMNGVKPVVLAIILQALISLSGGVLRTNLLRLASLAALAGCFCQAGEITILLLTGLLFFLTNKDIDLKTSAYNRTIVLALAVVALLLIAGDCGLIDQALGRHNNIGQIHTQYSLFNLFCYFAKVGSVLFGSGYVLIAFLQTDLVHGMQWLSTSQLLDATAIGQVTPGPVFTTATFIGYILGGVPGAMAATCGIFLPAFGFVALTAPHLHKLRQSKAFGHLLDGINAASLALMGYAFLQLVPATLTGFVSILILASCVLISTFKPINSVWLITAGAVIGYFFL